MYLNATFIAQMVVFFILGWFTMKFVWPPLMKALDDRAKKIADGLEAAEQGKQALDASSRQAADEVDKARNRAAEIISQAEKRSVQMIEEAKGAAREEGNREKAAAKAEIDQEAVTRSQPWLWRVQKRSCAVKLMPRLIPNCCRN